MALSGAELGLAWAAPFTGLLLSIAVMPLAAPSVWHHHFGKIAASWTLALLIPFWLSFGAAQTGDVLVHTLLAEYLPFTVLLCALYTASGGIYIRGNLHGSPRLNVALMLVGALLASIMGTTGAAMLLIRPLIRANDNRRHNAHVVIFFIFIVGNIGGALTPLGDPPLFLGFLQGVGFFWTAGQLWSPTLFLVAGLLAVFWIIDSWLYRKEGITRDDPTPDSPGLGVDGAINLLPLAAVVGLVLMSGTWKPGVVFDVRGTPLALQALVRDLGLVAVTAVSLLITPAGVRASNQFSWAPMQEVAKLFIAIFLTMVPVLAMLRAGEAGVFAPLARQLDSPWAYFWLAGSLSSVLDNAPTYLAFFNLAGGDAQRLMTDGAAVLAAISAGSVFMGAMTYIGNAPNFMVKAIAEDRGVKMPSFGGYLLWSGAVLLPLLFVMALIWMH
ncbi:MULTISPECIES: sodium:proton antiporter [unclassified Roseateles]|uniref:sodium:proton antiporter n=1 Tax=unclassified Roseateles TaxID=2626991 RepID=UPI0006FF3902|nr:MULTISPECIES: sodium:proton antiporter [unclassified Roseateles]KQW52247.1 sodium:proton antiporter [Pelomonas sp. Root405]KRA78481.1 sodium:proton antiporter [Pelomonas sp. Root662]